MCVPSLASLQSHQSPSICHGSRPSCTVGRISSCSPSKLQSISLPNSIHLLWRLRRRTARVCSPCSKLGVQSSAEELKSTNKDLKQLHKVHQAGPECHFGLGGL